MNTPAYVRQQVEQALSGIRSRLWNLLYFTRVSATSADGSADGVEGWPGTEGDPPSPQQTVRRMEPWGVHGRPAGGVQAIIARVLGGAASGLQLGVWTGAHGRQDLAEGETQLYCAADGCEVYLDKDGNANVRAGGAVLSLDKNGNVLVTTPTGGTITLQPATAVATAAVLIQGSTDSWGVPVTQLPTASNLVKAG